MAALRRAARGEFVVDAATRQVPYPLIIAIFNPQRCFRQHRTGDVGADSGTCAHMGIINKP